MIITRHNASYWQVTINNPPLNVFDPELLNGLEYLMDTIKSEPELKMIVFDSAIVNYFIAHFDVLRGQEILNKKTKSGLLPWFDVVQELYDSPVISIASIRRRARVWELNLR